MYDSTLPLAAQMGEMRLGEGSDSVKDSLRGANDEQKGKGEATAKRRFPEEEEEDMLRETNDRFVLFPIKYHEVGRWRCRCTLANDRSGQPTKRHKRRSGPLRKSICRKTPITGTTA
jgi:hypothetical protein